MFGRLTQQAQAVLAATNAVAAELGHGWIGTEHLVLGLARQEHDERAAGPRVLRELGPGEQAVRDHVLKRLPPTRRRSDHQLLDDSPYPSALRLVLERASQAGLRRGGAIGSDHLLIGLLEERSCAGARFLAELDVTLDKVLRQLDRERPRGHREAAPSGPAEPAVTLTAAAVPVLELARQQAVQDGSGGTVGTQHYLLALLSQPDTVAAKLLSAFGVDYTLAKARLMELDEDEPLEPPRPAPARAPSNTRRVEVPNDERFEALVGEVARLLPAGAPLGFNSDGEIGWIVTSGNVDLADLVKRARARIAPRA